MSVAFHTFKEPIYKKGVSYFLMHLIYLQKHYMYHNIINNPQCFNEVICETSLSFYASELEHHPLNNDFKTCKNVWKEFYIKRQKNEVLNKFLNIKSYHSTLDCATQTVEIKLIYDSLLGLFSDISNDRPCIYPQFKNGRLFLYFILL